MSSNQWELVTKTKKQKNLEKKVEARTEKKRLAALEPRLDEILPQSQYRNIITGKGGKGNNSPAKSSSSSSSKSKSPKKKDKSSKEQTSKKQGQLQSQSQQQQQQQPKTKVAPKPKSLEAAMRGITAEDFGNELEKLKISYPGSELLWLRGIAGYFNSKMPFDCDPIFSGKSLQYPTNLAAPTLKKATVDFLHSVGEENLSYFYHSLMVSMCDQLSKNSPIVGYKFLLQLIGHNWPQICSDNMAKTALLRNSYQNRSNICLSILWAVGQGGYQQLTEGIKIWQNLMLPNIEMKSYSKFVVEYLEKILSNAQQNSTINMNQTEFFNFYNALKANYPISKDNQEVLYKCAEEFLLKYISSTTKHSNIFLTLFRNIEDPHKNHSELAGCINCLLRNPDGFKVWKMNYKKQLVPSILLLKKIGKDLGKTESDSFKLLRSKTFHEFLAEAQELNSELDMAKKRDPHLDELMEVTKNVQSSAQQKKKHCGDEKKKCGCCKWMMGSLFLICLIGGVLAYDTQVNGKGVFEKSATGKVLKNAGLLPYVEKGWYTTMSASARGYKWAEKNVPPYAKPAGQLICDLYKLGRNTACNVFGVVREFVNSKLPVAANFLEQYVPGLPKRIDVAWTATKDACVNISVKTVAFFKTNVLVGRLSPENLSKALNQTQNAVLDYYYIFHKKVDAYAKLK